MSHVIVVLVTFMLSRDIDILFETFICSLLEKTCFLYPGYTKYIGGI